MSNWLNPNNGFFTFMGKVFDIIVLNLLWLLLCIPIVTIIPATTAMYYAIVKVIRRERGYVSREFFRSFKRNFRYGSFYSIIMVAGAFILYVDFAYSFALVQAGEALGNTIMGVFLMIALLVLSVLVYLCPVLSRFDMKFMGIIKTSFYLASRHFLKTLVFIVLLAVGVLGSIVFVPGIFFLPAVCTLLTSFLMEGIFKKYMPAKTERPEGEGSIDDADKRETVEDEWYLE